MYIYKLSNGSYIESRYPISGSSGVEGTADYHGGYAFEHRSEMKEIAEEVANEICDRKIEQCIEELYKAAYTEAYAAFINDLNFDVETCVNVALENASSILNDRRTQKVLAEHIIKEIKKNIKF